MPDLDGLEVPEVESKLSDAGLKADINERTSLIDEFLPGDPFGLRAGFRARDRGAARHHRARRGRQELLSYDDDGVKAISAIRGSPRSRTTPKTIEPS